MRIICVSLMLLSFIPASGLQAQTLLGVQVGGNIASASTSSQLSHSVAGNSGFLAGLVAETSLGRNFVVRIEPTYVQKGAEIEAAYFGIPYNHLVRITSVDIPILVQYNILPGPLVPVAFLGANAGFNLSAEDSYAAIKIGNTVVTGSRRQIMDLTDNCESFDLLLEIGAGVEYVIKEKTRIFVNARYSYGLLNQVHEGYMIFDGTWNTSDVRIEGGFKIPVW
jgi:hypothetical protein